MRKNLALLDPFQLEGAAHLIAARRAACWVLMGRGKTIIVLTALMELNFKHALIVAPPFVAMNTWPDEIADWEHIDFTYTVISGTPKQRLKKLTEPTQIKFISTSNLVWLIEQYTPAKFPFDVVVIDESGMFKALSKRTKAMLRASKYKGIRFLWELTGTPIANSYEGLWTQIKILDGGERLGNAKGEYLGKYFDEETKSVWNPKKQMNITVRDYTIAQGAPSKIQDRIRDIVYVVPADDSSLPPMTLREIKLTLPPSVREIYDRFKQKSYYEFEQEKLIAAESSGIAFQKLVQIATGSIYLTQDIEDPEYYGLTESQIRKLREVQWLHDEKLSALTQIIESLAGEPLLMAYSYIHERERIGKVKGVTLLDKRKKIGAEQLKAFQAGEVEVLACHAQSIGHGLNLQHNAHNALWFSLPCDNEIYQQFNYRLQRRGQKHQVIINHLLMKGTIEEVIFSRLQQRGMTQDQLIAALVEYVDS